MMRQKLVIANWKLNGSASFIRDFVQDLGVADISSLEADVVICPPFAYLETLIRALDETLIDVGSQDVSANETGAYTGEVAADMIADIGAKYAIVGHSERRAYHDETDDLVVEKTKQALAAGLTPVCCVGESLDDRQSGKTELVVGDQVRALIDAFKPLDHLDRLVIAYEPVWAIGTGKTAQPEEAQAVHAFIRNLLDDAGPKVSILYGGSVKPANAKELFSQPDIDGGLIGGASLVPQDFIDICRAADS